VQSWVQTRVQRSGNGKATQKGKGKNSHAREGGRKQKIKARLNIKGKGVKRETRGGEYKHQDTRDVLRSGCCTKATRKGPKMLRLQRPATAIPSNCSHLRQHRRAYLTNIKRSGMLQAIQCSKNGATATID